MVVSKDYLKGLVECVIAYLKVTYVIVQANELKPISL